MHDAKLALLDGSTGSIAQRDDTGSPDVVNVNTTEVLATGPSGPLVITTDDAVRSSVNARAVVDSLLARSTTRTSKVCGPAASAVSTWYDVPHAW